MIRYALYEDMVTIGDYEGGSQDMSIDCYGVIQMDAKRPRFFKASQIEATLACLKILMQGYAKVREIAEADIAVNGSLFDRPFNPDDWVTISGDEEYIEHGEFL